MSNAIFPTLPGLAWAVTKTPEFHTETFTSANLTEQRLSLTPYPVYNITLTYEFLRSDSNQELQTLIGFFMQRQGSFDNFLYTDPNDNTAGGTGTQIGTGDGATTAFQLVRSLGGFVEPVMNINGTPQIYVGGTLQTPGTDYTISPLGMVNFTSAPPSGQAVIWKGSFYYRCRFAEDKLDFENFMYQLHALKKCELRGSTGNKI